MSEDAGEEEAIFGQVAPADSAPEPPERPTESLGQRLRRLARVSVLVRLAGRSLPVPLLIALGVASSKGLRVGLVALPFALIFLLPGLVELDAERQEERSWPRFTLALILAALAGVAVSVPQAAYLSAVLEGRRPAAALSTTLTLLSQQPTTKIVLIALLFGAGPIVLSTLLRQDLEAERRFAVASNGTLLLSLVASVSAVLLGRDPPTPPVLVALFLGYALFSGLLCLPALLCDWLVRRLES